MTDGTQSIAEHLKSAGTHLVAAGDLAERPPPVEPPIEPPVEPPVEPPIEPPPVARDWPGYGAGADAHDDERTEYRVKDGDWRSLIAASREEGMRVEVPDEGAKFLGRVSGDGRPLVLVPGVNTKIRCRSHDALLSNIQIGTPDGECTVVEGFTVALPDVTHEDMDGVNIANDADADIGVLAYCTFMPAPDLGVSIWSSKKRGEGPGRFTFYRVYFPPGRHPANTQTRQHAMLAGAKEDDHARDTKITLWESVFEQQMRVPKVASMATIHAHRCVISRWTYDASHVKEHAHLKLTSSVHDGEHSNAKQRPRAVIREAPGNLDISDHRWLSGASMGGKTPRNTVVGRAVNVPYEYGTGLLTDEEIEAITAGAGAR